jgi:hypothetical protein
MKTCSSLSSISRALFTLNSVHKAKLPTKLIMWKYWSSYMKLCIGKGLNFGPMIVLSTMTMLQLTRCSLLGQAVHGPKTNYQKGTPTLFTWFGSEWLLAIYKNVVYFKGTNKCGDSTESNMTTGIPKMFPTVG